MLGGQLKEFEEEIAWIKERLPLESHAGTPIDELFILRFLLSHGGANANLEKVKELCIACIAWRVQNQTLLQAYDEETHHLKPKIEHLLKFSKVGYGGYLGDNPLFIIRVGHCDLNQIVRELSTKEIEQVLLACEENSFQMIDRLTREQGKMIKLTTICDLSSLGLRMPNLTFLKALARVSKKSSLYYPQLIDKKIFCNVPKPVQVMFRMYNSLFHRRVQKKHLLCKNTNKGGTCPFLQKESRVELPDFLGGILKDYDRTLRLN